MTVGSQVKQCLASLKSVKAGLETFAQQSVDIEAKQTLQHAADDFEQIITDIQNRISELEREEPQYKGF